MDSQTAVIHRCLNEIAEHFDDVAAEIVRQTTAALARDEYEVTGDDAAVIVLAAHVTFSHLLETLTLTLRFDL